MTQKYSTKLPINNNPLSSVDKESLNRLFDCLFWVSPIINPSVGQVEPPAEYRRAGALAYADGVNWNPGAGGEGIYYFNSAGNWIKL